MKRIVGVFDSVGHAESAANEIKSNGLKTDDISIITKEDNTKNQEAQGRNDDISGGTVTGGILGGLAGLALGLGTIAVPGLGLIAAAGPVTGVLAGAASGGIAGGLVDLGIPEDKSRHYEQKVKQGKVFFSMDTEDNKINQVISSLQNSGAESVETY